MTRDKVTESGGMVGLLECILCSSLFHMPASSAALPQLVHRRPGGLWEEE